MSIAEDLSEVVELDLNPLLVMPHDAMAVDCRVRVTPVRSTRTLSADLAAATGAVGVLSARRTAPILVTSGYGVLVLT